MDVTLTFHGAARTTTGSMHLLDIDGTRVLLDCGLYQGKRKEAFEKNRNLPFDPASVDKVILSHAHIDHSGNLPTLVTRGFKGEIFATPATCDLCDIMLRDSAFIQTKDVEYVNKKRIKRGKKPFEPLYEPEDIDGVMDRFRRVPYETPVEVAPGTTATLHDAAHLLGSATVALDFKRNGRAKRLLFTGDLGRNDMPILRNPKVVQGVDVLITESTYGNRVHPPKADVQAQLKRFIDKIHKNRSKLIIPSFSVGRTQQIVYFLNELYAEGRIPHVPVFVDSPLSSRATEVYEKHPECYDRDAFRMVIEGDDPFQFKDLKYTTKLEDSMKLNGMRGPAVIISASGMCEAGRILHHLKHNIEDPKNIILIVGYQAEHTLGRRLIEHVSPVRILGDKYRVNARVHTINALSAHADRNELLYFVKGMDSLPGTMFVVHGEEEQSEALARELSELGAHTVEIPYPGQTFKSIPGLEL
jgi:metallo-beta-lactamase family protein